MVEVVVLECMMASEKCYLQDIFLFLNEKFL